MYVTVYYFRTYKKAVSGGGEGGEARPGRHRVGGTSVDVYLSICTRL